MEDGIKYLIWFIFGVGHLLLMLSYLDKGDTK